MKISTKWKKNKHKVGEIILTSGKLLKISIKHTKLRKLNTHQVGKIKLKS